MDNQTEYPVDYLYFTQRNELDKKGIHEVILDLEDFENQGLVEIHFNNLNREKNFYIVGWVSNLFRHFVIYLDPEKLGVELKERYNKLQSHDVEKDFPFTWILHFIPYIREAVGSEPFNEYVVDYLTKQKISLIHAKELNGPKEGFLIRGKTRSIVIFDQKDIIRFRDFIAELEKSHSEVDVTVSRLTVNLTNDHDENLAPNPFLL